MTLAEAEKVEMELIENGTEGVEAWRVLCALMCFYRYYKDTCKTENRPSDESSTTEWVNIPESPNEAEIVEKRLDKLEDRVDSLEVMVEQIFQMIKTIGGWQIKKDHQAEDVEIRLKRLEDMAKMTEVKVNANSNPNILHF